MYLLLHHSCLPLPHFPPRIATRYENANEWYKNLDRLIGYIQANADTYNVDAFYSTPVNYTAAVYGADHAWTVGTCECVGGIK